MKHKDLHHFPSRPPGEILQEIIDLKRRKENGEPIELPLITVMHSKSSMSGFLIDFRKDVGGRAHLIMSLIGSSDIFFAEATRIEGLIVHDIDKIDYLLYDLDSDQIAMKKQVTRYEVKKRIAEETDRLASFFGKEIQLKVSDELLDRFECFYIKNLVTDIVMTLLTMAERPGKRTEIKNAIDEIVLKKGADLSIQVEMKSLSFTDTLSRSYSTNFQRGKLESAIREVL